MAFGAFVQSSGWAGFNSGTSINRSLTGVTAGDILFFAVPYGSTQVGTWTVSDSVNNWHIAQNDTSGFGYGLVAYALNVASGSVTVTASVSGSSGGGGANLNANLLEYSATSTAIVDTSIDSNGASYPPGTLPSITTAQANELVCVLGADGSTMAIGSPFTVRNSTNYVNAADDVLSTSISQSISLTGASGNAWSVMAIAFAASSPVLTGYSIEDYGQLTTFGTRW